VVATAVALPTELMLVQLGTDISYVYSDPLTHQQTRFRPDDLAILKFRNWGFRPWLGIPPLLCVADTLGGALAARGLASSEFRNGTQLAGYLSTANKLDRQKAEDIRDRWRGAYSGVNQAFKTPVLEQGLEYKQITSRDMAALQLAELARMSDIGVCMSFGVPPSSIGLIDKTTRSTIEDESRRLASLALQPLAVRVGDAVGQLLLSDQERASGVRVTINLESLVRGFGLELSEALSRYVLGGIMSRSEARRAIGLPGRADTDPMFQPINIETVDQAQQRQDRADAAQETTAAHATAANSNVAASLIRALDGLRPLAVDVAAGDLERSSVVARLESGQEVVVDLADIRKALAVDIPSTEEGVSEVAE
jgi:HK97 family phage portal protein